MNLDAAKLQPYIIQAGEPSAELEWLFDNENACESVDTYQFVGFMGGSPMLLEWRDESNEAYAICVDSNCVTDSIEQHLVYLWNKLTEHAYSCGSGQVFIWTVQYDRKGRGTYVFQFYMYDAETTPGGIYI